MLNVSDEVKALFTDGKSHSYDMKLEFGTTKYFTTPDFTLTSKDISAESARLEETLISGTDYDFGAVCPSKFSCSVFTSRVLVGKFLKVTLIYDTAEIPYGRFYVTECNKTSDQDDVTLTAYDYLYLLNLKDTSKGWNATHGYGRKPSSIVNTILQYTGLQAETMTFVNDFTINDIIVKTTLTYADILKNIGELNGGWFRMTRDGLLRFVTLETPLVNRTGAEEISEYLMGTLKNGDYTAGVIDSVSYTGNVGGETQTVVYPSGDVEHTYVLSADNDWLNNLTTTELNTRLSAIYALIQGLSYNPQSLQCDGRPYLEVGDRYYVNFVSVTRNGNETSSSVSSIFSYIFNQSISGIGGLVHSIEANGDESKTISETERQRQINALMRNIAMN